ncbi:MAG: LysE family translocator [Pelagimonas sp.]
MISPEFLAIWLAWTLAGASPGPATLGIASTAMARGRRAGLGFALGILAGSASWGIAAALGVSALMLANAWVFEIIRYAGASYLLWLALKALKRVLQPSEQGALSRPYQGSFTRLFTKGALVHLTNPKAIIGWGSIYAIAAPAEASVATLFGYFGLLFSASICVFLGYAVAFSSPQAVRLYRGLSRWFDLLFAGFFGVASFKILTARL